MKKVAELEHVMFDPSVREGFFVNGKKHGMLINTMNDGTRHKSYYKLGVPARKQPSQY